MGARSASGMRPAAPPRRRSGLGRRGAAAARGAAAVGLALLAVLAPARAGAWGLGTHRWVAIRAAELAEGRCPALVRGHGDELATRAVEPDAVLKARFGRTERVRHFLDLDEYGAPPFAALPRDFAAAVKRHGRRTVEERGTLPWHGGKLARRLREELGRGELAQARITAGHLAHYAADATMPLHATKNHDGQLTGQRGLHRRLEAGLVDARLDRYAPRARRARRRPPIAPERSEAALFAALERAYELVPRLLAADRAARRDTRAGSAVYYRRLDADVGGLLADQVGAAATLTAALWDGACAGAGGRRGGAPRPTGP
jgi:hypothetical protein